MRGNPELTQDQLITHSLIYIANEQSLTYVHTLVHHQIKTISTKISSILALGAKVQVPVC